VLILQLTRRVNLQGKLSSSTSERCELYTHDGIYNLKGIEVMYVSEGCCIQRGERLRATLSAEAARSVQYIQLHTHPCSKY
jgi:hypothetical protein